MFRAKEGHNAHTNLRLDWAESLNYKEIYSDDLLREKRKKNAEEIARKHNMYVDR